MLAKVQCVIVGGGCIGVAIGRALAQSGVECILCERHGVLGEETTSRNSEVIHAGMYYAANSFKAKFCVSGKDKLITYLEERRLPHRLCGKLIVAQNDVEHGKLHEIRRKGAVNGVHDLKLLTGADVRALEPSVRCHSALLSPRTGIFDSHEYTSSLHADFETARVPGMTVFRCEVHSITAKHEEIGCSSTTGHAVSSFASSVRSSGSSEGCRYVVETNQGSLGCDSVINAAGLSAVAVAAKVRNTAGRALLRLPRSYFCKGNYFKYQPQEARPGAGAVRLSGRLVYPIPPTAHTGLGVHATVDLQGAVKFGPDMEWLQPDVGSGVRLEDGGDGSGDDEAYEFNPSIPPRFSYSVDPARADKFYEAIRQYYPDLPDGSLVPDYSGVRPKLCGPHFGKQPACDSGATGLQYDRADFFIESNSSHGLRGLVNCYGLESPALTASMAIAEHVRDLVVRDLQ